MPETITYTSGLRLKDTVMEPYKQKANSPELKLYRVKSEKHKIKEGIAIYSLEERSNSTPSSPNDMLTFNKYTSLKSENSALNDINLNEPEIKNTRLYNLVEPQSRIGSSEPVSIATSPTLSNETNISQKEIIIENINKNCEQLALATAPKQDWIHCFCEVRFDLETGQAVDRVYPEFPLSEEELNTIAFSAFPDTRVFDTGDMVYQFRVRKANVKICKSKNKISSNEILPDEKFYTGYAYFRQRKDARVHRGYYQKSIVLLTSLPMSNTVGLFTHLITSVGSLYHDYDYGQSNMASQVFLEAALQDLSRWPSPVYSTTLEVPFAGTVLQIEMPDNIHPTLQLLETAQLSTAPTPTEKHLLASVPDGSSPGLLLHWWDRLSDLWTLWELMLLGEPIVVMAPDPATCSHVITELLDLIKPIPYCGDYRPYITIQDPDLKAFANKNCIQSSTIIGVTNPFFNEALAHWPNWIQVGAVSTPIINSNENKNKFKFKGFQFSTIKNSKAQLKNNYRAKGVYTTRKSCIIKDKQLIQQLTTSMLKGDRSATVLNNKLRRYFGELTERFLAPLNRYMSTLMPTNISAAQCKPPTLKTFKNEDFLKSLEEHGISNSLPHFEWNKELYKQFLRCGNFATWLHARIQRSQQELTRLHIEQLCNLNIDRWIIQHDEVEIVDLVLKLNEYISQLELSKVKGNRINAKAHSSTKSDFSIDNTKKNSSRISLHKHSASSPIHSSSLSQKDRLITQKTKALALLPKDMQSILKSE